MDNSTSPDPNLKDPVESKSEQSAVPEKTASTERKKVSTFWRGLQTALGAAFIVATLFTLWTPGSLIDSGLEVRMAQALDSASGEPVPFEATPDPTAQAQFNRIGIVAGHYGSDPGAVCSNGVTEAELNLEIATLVQKNLSDRGYEVDLLEEFDDRLYGYQGAVLLSIHLDSCNYVNDQATGFKVAAALSEQNYSASQRLISCLSDRYNEQTGLPYHAGSVTDDMTYYHAFTEIDPNTVAAIIEAGFMNMDYRFLTEQTDQVAEGIAEGILCYLNEEAIEPPQNP